jgi:hypothetical protein
MIAAVLAMAIFAGVWIVKATRDDNHHLMHGPSDGCLECEGK